MDHEPLEARLRRDPEPVRGQGRPAPRNGDREVALDKPRDIEGFESVERGPHEVLIRPDWKGWLLEDLLDDFARVPRDSRRLYSHGRVEHFSYLPSGAPGRVFVRRAARGGALGAMLGGLYAGAGRPLRELQASAAARRAGVSVPEPVAVRSTRVCGPWRRFTVVTREVPEAADLLSLAPGLSPARKRALILRVADEMRRLHDAGIYHGDLTMKNILLSGEDVTIIDFDKATLAGAPDERLAVRNLARLNRSVVKLFGGRGIVTSTDKLRFLRRYLKGRERMREMAEICGSGLWAHRLWWSLSGQA